VATLALAFAVPTIIFSKDRIACRNQFMDHVPISIDVLRIAMENMENRLGGAIGDPGLPVKGKTVFGGQFPITSIHRAFSF
jgi:hypothetical protein